MKKYNFIFTLVGISLITLVLGLSFWKKIHTPNLSATYLSYPVPDFQLPSAIPPHKSLNKTLFLGSPHIVHAFASWCHTCEQEAPLISLLAPHAQAPWIGLSVHDTLNNTISTLDKYPNPYQDVLLDPDGHFSFQLGLTGTPETFIIDKHAVVRLKIQGPLTEELINTVINPFIQKLSEE